MKKLDKILMIVIMSTLIFGIGYSFGECTRNIMILGL